MPGRPLPWVGGSIAVPASKSHTVRALLIASFTEGTSRLIRPLVSRDTLSCRGAAEALGARIWNDGADWLVEGFGSRPARSGKSIIHIDVGNSGTTLYLASAMAALGDIPVRFDGDGQIRRRTAAPLLNTLKALGARVESAPGGCAPFTVTGPLMPGRADINCPVSQYLSALLLAAPLIKTPASYSPNATTLGVLHLNEAPYVEMTLDWLKQSHIRYEQNGWKQFCIPANQHYKPFEKEIPADWSSAMFFMAAAAITQSTLFLRGLNLNDSQGDKAVTAMLEKMGCRIREVKSAGVSQGIEISGAPLQGAVHNLNATPDALPGMAAVCAFAQGESRLKGVPQARLKETDRIAVMCAELAKLGAETEELPDGIIIRGTSPGRALRGCTVDGHNDHRVVMALAAAALGCEGHTDITGAEAAAVTFPEFFKLLEQARNAKDNT